MNTDGNNNSWRGNYLNETRGLYDIRFPHERVNNPCLPIRYSVKTA